MKIFRDQTGRDIHIPDTPSRIVSLVPSQTELLFDLGLQDQICGLTKFCIHPSHARQSKVIVGGTKDFKPERIRQLNPDFILANKEENDELLIHEISKGFPVWISDIQDLDSALDMIRSVGEICNVNDKAQLITDEILNAFSEIKPIASLRIFYLIWQNPIMIAAKGTFINDMLERCGFIQADPELKRYPELTVEDIRNAEPDIIFLSSEPYPFREKHRIDMQNLFPASKVILVDGEMFSWYGSRLRSAPSYFNQLIDTLR